MAEYPIIMKQKNDQGEYDTLYPQTLGSQIQGNIQSSQIEGDIPSSQISGTFPVSQITGLPDLTTYGSNVQLRNNQLPYGNLPVGTICQLNENGVPQNYIVVHQGLPSDKYDSSCNGTWLLRQNIYANAQWDSSNSNIFTLASVNKTYLPNLLSIYDSDIQSVIKTVTIPYCVGNNSSTVNSGSNGYSTKLFLLSGYEVGWTTSTNSYFPVDGAVLSYFQGTASTDSKRIAYLNGSATYWWLRSPGTHSTYNVWLVNSNGGYNDWGANNSCGVRPALIMPFDAPSSVYEETLVYPDDTNIVSQIQSVLGLDNLSNVKIETGSYTGTGKYGQNNPNSLTFSFVPKMVFISTPTISFSPYTIFYGQESAIFCIGPSGSIVMRGVNSISWSNKSVGWYCTSEYETDKPTGQLNTNGTTYYYMAIG